MKYNFLFRRDVKIKFLNNYVDKSLRGKTIDSIIYLGFLKIEVDGTFRCCVTIDGFWDIDIQIPGHDEIEALTNTISFISWQIYGSASDEIADIYQYELGDGAGFPRISEPSDEEIERGRWGQATICDSVVGNCCNGTPRQEA